MASLESRLEEKRRKGSIVVEVGRKDEFSQETLNELESLPKEYVDYFASSRSYVISSIGYENKISEGYSSCTGVIVVGTDRDTGKEISLMTHQDSWAVRRKTILKKNKPFDRDMHRILKEFKSRVRPETMHAVIFAGNIGSPEYPDVVEHLSSLIEDELGFEPRVAAGPSDGVDSVTFDTQNRYLYILRGGSGVGDNIVRIKDFPASEVRKRSKSWRKTP